MGMNSVVSASKIEQVDTDTEKPSRLLVIDGAEVIEEISSRYERKLKKWHKRMKLLEDPIFPRAKHCSNGKEYHGRYFYERVWDEEEQRIKHKYIGIAVPEDYVPEGGFPPAPENPLEGLEVQVIGSDVIVSSKMFDKFHHLFEDHFVTKIGW